MITLTLISVLLAFCLFVLFLCMSATAHLKRVGEYEENKSTVLFFGWMAVVSIVLLSISLLYAYAMVSV